MKLNAVLGELCFSKTDVSVTLFFIQASCFRTFQALKLVLFDHWSVLVQISQHIINYVTDKKARMLLRLCEDRQPITICESIQAICDHDHVDGHLHR